MKKTLLFLLLLPLLSACDTKGTGDVYLFTYFIGQEDGLRLAYSRDGLNWKNISDTATFIKPEVGSSLMRDPSAVMGPDGTYHLVWTTGWNDDCIGHASTKDFINWSEQQRIDVMAGYPNTINTWAPEITYDENDGYFYIYWAGRLENENTDFRIYYTKTRDFSTFSPTEIFYYEGFSLIDATLLKNKSGKGWYFFLKDARDFPENDKFIRFVAVNGDLEDGIRGELSEPLNGDFWAEGPTSFYVGDDIYVYFDRYKDDKFGTVKSSDGGKTWTDISDQVSLPDGIRHGSVITVPEELVERISCF